MREQGEITEMFVFEVLLITLLKIGGNLRFGGNLLPNSSV